MSEFDDNSKQQQNNSHQGVAKLIGYSNFKRHNPMTDRFQVGGRQQEADGSSIRGSHVVTSFSPHPGRPGFLAVFEWERGA